MIIFLLRYGMLKHKLIKLQKMISQILLIKYIF